MQLDIHARNISVTRTLQETATGRLSQALGRFTHRIARVTLRLYDTNGRRGGVDVEALALVELRQGTRLVVRGMYSSPQEAVSGMIERVRTSVQRCQDRLVQSFRGA